MAMALTYDLDRDLDLDADVAEGECPLLDLHRKHGRIAFQLCAGVS